MRFERVRIGDLGEIITGKTPSTKNPEYWGGCIPFVSPKDIQTSKHIYQTERMITDSGKYAVKGSILPPHTICVSCIGNIGYTGMTTKISVSNQQINSIIVNPDNDPDYVFYLMRSLWPFFKNYEGQSTTLSILNKTQFSKIEVQVPSLSEQKAIAAVLSALDDKIEINNRINDNLQQQAFSLFDSLLQVRQEATVPLSSVAELNPKRDLGKNTPARCIDMARLSTSGSFPDGWEIKPYNGGMKFCNGDTLLARITPCLENGKTAYIDFLDAGEVAFGSTEYIVMCPKGDIPPEFLYCLAIANIKNISSSRKSGTSFYNRQQIPT